jgi:hypothetical protein
MSDKPIKIQGEGFDSRTGGFAIILIDGIRYTPEQLAAELARADAAERDAERYRWLREQHESDAALSFTVFMPEDCDLAPVGSMPGELDAAIDAALTDPPKGATETSSKLQAVAIAFSDAHAAGRLAFASRIEAMNRRYELGVSAAPALVGGDYPAAVHRLELFKRVLREEFSELEEVVALAAAETVNPREYRDPLNVLVPLADLLADIIVYCRSEATRWGIPLEDVLDIVMDSNDSKMGADGRPIKSPDGAKFLKGPNYWKPEPKIRDLLWQRATGYRVPKA